MTEPALLFLILTLSVIAYKSLFEIGKTNFLFLSGDEFKVRTEFEWVFYFVKD